LSLFGADNMGGPRDTRMGRATYIDRSDGLWFRNNASSSLRIGLQEFTPSKTHGVP